MLCIPRRCYGGWRRTVMNRMLKRKRLFFQTLCSLSAVVLTGKIPSLVLAPVRFISRMRLPTGCRVPCKSDTCRKKGGCPFPYLSMMCTDSRRDVMVALVTYRSIRLQHVGSGGFHIWHAGCQPRPKAQEIGARYSGKFPMLKKPREQASVTTVFLEVPIWNLVFLRCSDVTLEVPEASKETDALKGRKRRKKELWLDGHSKGIQQNQMLALICVHSILVSSHLDMKNML